MNLNDFIKKEDAVKDSLTLKNNELQASKETVISKHNNFKGLINKKIKNNTSEDNVLRVFEAFAGYGGASFGLKRANIPHKVIGYSEIDKFAIEFFENNHPGIFNYGGITKIDPNELPDFDLFTGGFPCQPFSQVGLGKGEEDIRGTLFYDIIRICEAKRPKHILLENVKGLMTSKHGKTLETIKQRLIALGYDVIVKLLNSKDYGIPQNRARVWIYAYHGTLPKGLDKIINKNI